MATWRNVSGDINTARNFYGLPIDGGTIYMFPTDSVGFYNNTTPIDASTNILFGNGAPPTVSGPTPTVPDAGGEGLLGQITTTWDRIVSIVRPPPAPPVGLGLPGGASYAVSGAATVNSVTVATAPGQVVTLSGALTSNGASVFQGPAVISGSFTEQTYAVVSARWTVSGTATFKGVATAVIGPSSQGQTSLALSLGAATISNGGKLNTAGLFIGEPGASTAAAGAHPRLNVNGTLTDTDTSTGIAIADGAGLLGTVFVAGGQVNSATVTDGDMGGAGIVELGTGATWTNTGAFAVGAAAMLKVHAGAQLKTRGLKLNGTATVDGGTITLTDTNGVLAVEQGATLTVSATGVVNTPLLETKTGSTTSFTAATLNNTGTSGVSGAPGAMLDGTVDWTGSTVTETAAGASVEVGYDDGNGSDSGTLAAKNATVSTNATIIGGGSAAGSGDGTLTISGGTWTDGGSGVTMMAGDGAIGTLHLTGGATLTDQDAAIGAAAAAGVSTAALDRASIWTVNGALAVGGPARGALTVASGSTVSVGGAVTVAAPMGGTSTLDVGSATLMAGGALTLGAAGAGDLTVTANGVVNAASGALHIVAGHGDVSGAGALVQAQSLAIDGSATNVANDLTIGVGADVQLSGAAGATVGVNSTLELAGGTLDAASVTVGQSGTLQGHGTIDGVGGGVTTSVQLNGGTLAVDGQTLEIDGTLAGGAATISNNATLKVTGMLGATTVAFNGAGRLVLGTSKTNATIANFGGNDFIDIANSADKAVVNGTFLTVSSLGQYVTSFQLAGTYAGVIFDVYNSGGGSGAEIAVDPNGKQPQVTPPVATPPATAPSNPVPGVATALSLGAISDPDANAVTATISDINGTLAATAAGSAIVQSEANRLVVSGSVADVNAALATLAYTATLPGADTVTAGIVDNLGNSGTQQVSFTVADNGLSVGTPSPAAVIAGVATPISGIHVANALADPALVFTVTLSDASGALGVIPAGSAVATGQGSATLTVSGDQDSVDRTLATLSYTGAVGIGAPAADTLSLAVVDSFGGTLSQTVGLTVAQPVTPTETDWATGEDGDAANAANWTAGLPTTALLTVTPAGDYTVAGAIAAGKVEVTGTPVFTGPVTASGQAGDYRTFAVDSGGDASFDGGTLATPSLVVGETGQGTVSLIDGAQATLSGSGPAGVAQSAYLGFGASASGVLDVAGATLVAATGLSVGNDGLASLNISAGGVVSTGSAGGSYAADTLGDAADGAGSIAVDGAGSQFNSLAPLYVGVAGAGQLAVTDGAAVVSGGPAGGVAAYVGYDAGGYGVASVDGVGTTWEVTQNLVAGFDGGASLSVTDGGTLKVDGALLRVGRDASAASEVEVYGPGATLTAPNALLSLGLDGTAFMTLGGGGAATVGSLVIGGNADAVATLEVDAGSTLTVLGTAADGAAAGTTITVAGGTIATGGGLDVGNGSLDAVDVSAGGVITGGITLGVGATLNLDQTASLGGTLTLAGGALSFADTSGDAAADSLATPITVSGAAQGSLDTVSPLTLTGTITFDPAGGANLLLGGGITLNGPVDGFQAGDTLDLENIVNRTQYPDTATWSNGVLSLTAVQYGGGAVFATVDLPGNFANTPFAVTPDAAGAGVDVTIACYVRGTRIATPGGEVAVERLAIGDLVVTASGASRPVRWIGRRAYAGRLLAPRPELLPVRFRAGCLGGGRPRRDLLVSPEHAMLLDGVLIPARCLVDGHGIVRERGLAQVEYFHVELDSHDAVLAEGAPSETFVDDDSRLRFHNAGEFSALYPAAAAAAPPARWCARRVEDGFQLEAVRHRLYAARHAA